MGDSSTATGTKKKKKGVFKSIGKGLSFRKKKQRPDDDSIIGVALDRSLEGGNGAAASSRSVGIDNGPRRISGTPSVSSSASSAASGSHAKPIRVVLLLMDPNSRRFELLQLEFDSTKAMVSDVLRQIQSSATESTLRDMAYAGVCDQSGTEMNPSLKLSAFCKGNDIVMAIPQGMTGRDAARLAGPILGDPKVEDMLAPCGVQVVKKPTKRSRSGTGSKLTQISEENNSKKGKKVSSPKKSRGKTKAKKSSKLLPTAVLGIIVSTLLFFTVQRHLRVTRPLESGQTLLPGQWISQCGIFDLFPEEWLEKLPMDKLSPSCDTATSSMLELGRDGTLRYFSKGEDGKREVAWSVAGGSGVGQCAEGDEEQCFGSGATFSKDGSTWFVEIDGTRTDLGSNVVRDFAVDS